MAEITITRALSELKTLKSRYENSVEELNLVAVKQGSKLRSPNTHIAEKDFEERAKALLQSSDALYERYLNIKMAIDQSNSVTVIHVGGKDMTIQQALVLKNTLDMRKMKLRNLKSMASAAKNDFERAESQNTDTIEKMISGSIGKDSTETQKKSAREEAENYIKNTKAVTMVDPCEIDRLIKELNDEIVDFETNIDYALSESNSVTHINIPD